MLVEIIDSATESLRETLNAHSVVITQLTKAQSVVQAKLEEDISTSRTQEEQCINDHKEQDDKLVKLIYDLDGFKQSTTSSFDPLHTSLDGHDVRLTDLESEVASKALSKTIDTWVRAHYERIEASENSLKAGVQQLAGFSKQQRELTRLANFSLTQTEQSLKRDELPELISSSDGITALHTGVKNLEDTQHSLSHNLETLITKVDTTQTNICNISAHTTEFQTRLKKVEDIVLVKHDPSTNKLSPESPMPATLPSIPEMGPTLYHLQYTYNAVTQHKKVLGEHSKDLKAWIKENKTLKGRLWKQEEESKLSKDALTRAEDSSSKMQKELKISSAHIEQMCAGMVTLATSLTALNSKVQPSIATYSVANSSHNRYARTASAQQDVLSRPENVEQLDNTTELAISKTQDSILQLREDMMAQFKTIEDAAQEKSRRDRAYLHKTDHAVRKQADKQISEARYDVLKSVRSLRSTIYDRVEALEEKYGDIVTSIDQRLTEFEFRKKASVRLLKLSDQRLTDTESITETSKRLLSPSNRWMTKLAAPEAPYPSTPDVFDERLLKLESAEQDSVAALSCCELRLRKLEDTSDTATATLALLKQQTGTQSLSMEKANILKQGPSAKTPSLGSTGSTGSTDLAQVRYNVDTLASRLDSSNITLRNVQ